MENGKGGFKGSKEENLKLVGLPLDVEAPSHKKGQEMKGLNLKEGFEKRVSGKGGGIAQLNCKNDSYFDLFQV